MNLRKDHYCLYANVCLKHFVKQPATGNVVVIEEERAYGRASPLCVGGVAENQKTFGNLIEQKKKKNIVLREKVQKKLITPNGGSLGSWVDEERSKLRVIV